MAPQLYLTAYKEQFASPGRAKRERLRPTSAHRRNNPQPRPDFLFPRSLQRCTPPRPPHSPPPTGRPLFPPVRHLSFHSPLTTCPDLSSVAKANHVAPVSLTKVRALPSAGGLQPLQRTEPPSALKNPARTSHQRNVHPLSAQQHRQHAGAPLRTRPQTSNPPHLFPWTQYRSGCSSCFHVVKPFQAGHYIIHPEFLSEGLR